VPNSENASIKNSNRMDTENLYRLLFFNEGVFAGVRDAVAALMNTRASIDEFVETEKGC